MLVNQQRAALCVSPLGLSLLQVIFEEVLRQGFVAVCAVTILTLSSFHENWIPKLLHLIFPWIYARSWGFSHPLEGAAGRERDLSTGQGVLSIITQANSPANSFICEPSPKSEGAEGLCPDSFAGHRNLSRCPPHLYH